MLEIIILSAFSLLAGFIDAVAGGGGLIQLPALLVFLPAAQQTSLAPIFGTNKFASLCGTSFATAQFARKIQINWRIILPAGVTALIFSFLGARIVALIDPKALRPIIFVLLILTLAYTAAKKDLGKLHAPKLQRGAELGLAIGVGALIGFYDGFFGPGTGSFLILIFVGLFGYDFLNASASAKVINLATNIAAVSYFGWTGNVMYQYAIPMAVCNVAGAWIGSHLALTKGNRFVRRLFFVVVIALIARLGYDLFR